MYVKLYAEVASLHANTCLVAQPRHQSCSAARPISRLSANTQQLLQSYSILAE